MTEGADSIILVLEDEFWIAEALFQELEAMALGPVHLASNVAAGRAVLEANKVRFAILDINLGTELVYPLAAEMVERQVPIIFHTSMNRRDILAPWSNYPMLPKPLQIAKLGAWLKEIGLGNDADFGGAVLRPDWYA